jgi:hypothetical protein
MYQIDTERERVRAVTLFVLVFRMMLVWVVPFIYYMKREDRREERKEQRGLGLCLKSILGQVI